MSISYIEFKFYLKRKKKHHTTSAKSTSSTAKWAPIWKQPFAPTLLLYLFHNSLLFIRPPKDINDIKYDRQWPTKEGKKKRISSYRRTNLHATQKVDREEAQKKGQTDFVLLFSFLSGRYIHFYVVFFFGGHWMQTRYN